MSQSRTYEMIHLLGPERALDWYLQWGCYPPVPGMTALAQEAIDACAIEDIDRILMDENGEDIARAFQIVRMFDLDPFVVVQQGEQG